VNFSKYSKLPISVCLTNLHNSKSSPTLQGSLIELTGVVHPQHLLMMKKLIAKKKLPDSQESFTTTEVRDDSPGVVETTGPKFDFHK